MIILLESLLVLVPVVTTLTLLACLFLAGLADRDEALRLAAGENWLPVESKAFDLPRP